MTYLEDGHCSLSNNLSENAILPFTVERKNWLFSASPKGATASAMVYTMVEMAKPNNLRPYYYLKHLYTELPTLCDKNENIEKSKLDILLPWSKELPDECRKSRR